jgi:hypothetical protein
VARRAVHDETLPQPGVVADDALALLEKVKGFAEEVSRVERLREILDLLK